MWFAGLFRGSVLEIVGAVDVEGFTTALQTSMSIGENLLVNLSLRLRLVGDRALGNYQQGSATDKIEAQVLDKLCSAATKILAGMRVDGKKGE